MPLWAISPLRSRRSGKLSEHPRVRGGTELKECARMVQNDVEVTVLSGRVPVARRRQQP